MKMQFEKRWHIAFLACYVLLSVAGLGVMFDESFTWHYVLGVAYVMVGCCFVVTLLVDGIWRTIHSKA